MIRLRTQYKNVNFTALEDGRLLLNGTEVGRLFPDEYHFLAMSVIDAGGEELPEPAKAANRVAPIRKAVAA
ncbi:MAG: hypothetical protein IT168_33375 [Bryobacterales bacterium]|nr:hypothetical protein [Bryobacterales bacterium]